MIFGAKEFRKAGAYKRRQAEKRRNSAILGRFGLFVFAYGLLRKIAAARIVHLDIKIILFPHLGIDLDGQAEEIDKSCGILLIVNFVFIEGCDLGII